MALYLSHMKGYTTAGVFLCVAFFIIYDKVIYNKKSSADVHRCVKQDNMSSDNTNFKGERYMVHINGKDENAAGMTIQKYLDDNDYKVTHIAVECNEKIIDKSDYSNYILKDNDVVEIVSFVGGGSGMSKDTFTLGGKKFSSRFILGSGKYSMELIKAAVENAGAQIITLAVRRTNTKKSENILDYIPEGVTLLPNTSGARDAKEAVRIARMSRELGCGDFVKIEIMKDSKYLLPDNAETVKATEILAKEGFTVLPYMYPDLYTARDLANAGAAAIMPLASPIGSNKGLATKEFIQIIIDESDLPVIVDAGIGKPSQAFVKLWRWEPPLSWQTRLLRRLVIFRQWQVHLSQLSKQEEVHILRDLDECLREVHRLLIRLRDF